MLRVLTTFMYIECIPFKTLETNNNYNRIKNSLRLPIVYTDIRICMVDLFRFSKKKKARFSPNVFIHVYIYTYIRVMLFSIFSKAIEV